MDNTLEGIKMKKGQYIYTNLCGIGTIELFDDDLAYIKFAQKFGWCEIDKVSTYRENYLNLNFWQKVIKTLLFKLNPRKTKGYT